MNTTKAPMKVRLMRGMPGSGKTFYVERVVAPTHTIHVVSADHFFVDRDGFYNFDPKKLGEAHDDCLRRYLNALEESDPAARPEYLLVDNTNATIAEMAPYMALASVFGVEAEIWEVACAVDTAVERNIHNVPEKVVEQIYKAMKANDNLLPSWWKRSIL